MLYLEFVKVENKKQLQKLEKYYTDMGFLCKEYTIENYYYAICEKPINEITKKKVVLECPME